MMRAALFMSTLAVVPSVFPAFAAGPEHFTLTAAFVPAARSEKTAQVSVKFSTKDSDLRLNEEPGPRLKLDASQTILVDKQPPPPSRIAPYDPDTARYIDTVLPVSFAVDLAPGAPKGVHTLKASVGYFYCSKREGWCRKGTTPVEFAVTVK